MNRFPLIHRATLTALVCTAGLTACRKPPLEFPFVQKYQVSAGDRFYFRQDLFVLLERRKALSLAVAPVGWVAYSYPDKITLSKPMERKPGDFWGSGNSGDMLETTTFTQMARPVDPIVFSPVGIVLAGGSADGSLWIWNMAQGVPMQLQDAAEIKALAFSPDGKILAAGLGPHIAGTTLTVNPGHVRIWDPAIGLLVEKFGAVPVNALAFASDGRLAVGSGDGSLVIRPAGGGAPAALQSSTITVTGLAWHPTGTALATAHDDKLIRLWDPVTGNRIGLLSSDIPLNPLFPRAIEQILFSADGTRFGAAYADGEMRIWDTSALNLKKP